MQVRCRPALTLLRAAGQCAAALCSELPPCFQTASPAAGAVPCWQQLGKPYALLPAMSHCYYRQQNPAVAHLSNLFCGLVMIIFCAS